MKDIPSPEKTRSVSESRLQDISTMVKQDQQDNPTVPTNPDRSCTYLVLRAHRMRHPMSKTSPQVSPRWRCKWLWFGPALREALARGAIIKMTLGLITPKGNVGGGEANGKTKVGPCWRSFIQSELSRGSHSPNRVRNAKSRNITPV